MTTPDPYARSVFRGKILDNATIARLKQAENRLGYELTILQGVGGAVASAGAHLGKNGEGGRAVDLPTYDAGNKLRVLADLGFCPFLRDDLPGVWSEHIHAVLIFDGRDNRRGIADVAWRQIGSWDAGRDGLSGNGPDPVKYRPEPLRGFSMDDYRATFAKPDPKPTRNNITRSRDRIVEAIHAAGQAAVLLEDADPKRTKAHAQVAELRQVRRNLREVLDALPKK